MKTLYIRNVPDAVNDQLAELASREGMSVSAFAGRELAQVARRAENRTLLESLPSHDISAEQVVDALHAARRGE